MTNHIYSNHSKNNFYKSELSIFFIIIAVLLVIILDSNFQISFLKDNLLSYNHKIIIFSIYVSVFISSSLFLLIKSYNKMIHEKIDYKNKYYFIIIFVILSLLISMLLFTMTEIIFYKSYSGIIFYLISYISFLSTIGFLSIISFRFLKLYKKGKNKFTFFYGILFLFYIITLIIAMIYLINGLAIHPSTINYTSPTQLRANTYSINILFQKTVADIYDVCFIISFLLAWIITISILKQYSTRIGKFKFWILVSLPLIFYLTRYQGILFSFMDYYEIIKMPYLGSISQSIGDSLYIAFANSNIQASGFFFGISFLPIILKLHNYRLINYMNITLIGMTLLFASRDFHAIFLNSVPPGGMITISFMSVGSFLLFLGILSFIKLASRDKQLFKEIYSRVESDSKLLKDIISSEKELNISKKIIPLFDFALKWQQKSDHEQINRSELHQIITDVISELRKKKNLNIKSKNKKKANENSDNLNKA